MRIRTAAILGLMGVLALSTQGCGGSVQQRPHTAATAGVTLSTEDWARTLQAATAGPVLGSSEQDVRIRRALEAAQPPPPAPTSIAITLTPDKTGALPTAVPAGTVSVSWAYMPHLNSAGGEVHYTWPRLSSTQTFTPPAGDPVVDAIAVDANGNPVGGWAGRIATAPATPPAAKLVVSLNTGGWGLENERAELTGVVNTLRVEDASEASLAAYQADGFKIIDLVNHPTTAGVQTVNREAFATEAVARAKAHSNIVASEIENEPQGPWFWGPTAESQASIEGYAQLVNTVVRRFAEAYATDPAAMPKLLWSADGGNKGTGSWGAKVYALLSQQAKELALPTVHPYGGHVERARSAEGNRARVTEAHALTGKPVWVTEVGWPTCVGCEPTGDSLQWTEAEQATNIQRFIEWSASSGAVGDVTVFAYRDYGTNAFYGVETREGHRKTSYGVLQTMAATYSR